MKRAAYGALQLLPWDFWRLTPRELLEMAQATAARYKGHERPSPAAKLVMADELWRRMERRYGSRQ